MENQVKNQMEMIDEEVLASRMYENILPVVDETTMVEITDINDMGLTVELLEYGNLSANVKLTELSRKRIKSIKQHAKIGKVEPMTVIEVNESKGYVDLSKKYITEEEIEVCSKRYQKSKSIYSIIWYLSENFPQYSIAQLNEMIVWPLYKSSAFSHPYFAFQAAESDFKKIFPDLEEKSPEIALLLQTIIKQRFVRKPIQLNAVVSLSCLSSEGVNTIKKVLKTLTDKLHEENEILSTENTEVKLIKPPLFGITSMTHDESEGTSVLTNIISEIANYAKSLEAAMVVVEPVSTNNPNILESEDDESENDNED